MIRGVMNDRLEPMVVVEISNGDGQFQPVEALLDTGFSENLTLPPDAVARLGLKYVYRIPLNLAGGQQIEGAVHEGFVKWFGRTRTIHVIAAEGQPLLGMSLLASCKVTIYARLGGEALIEEDREV